VGKRFSAAVQIFTGAQTASSTVGNVSASRDHPPPFSVEVEEKLQLYLYSPLCFHSLFQGEIYRVIKKRWTGFETAIT